MSTPADSGSSLPFRREADRRQRVLHVAKRLLTTLGADYFRSVVKHLGATFHADRVYLGELTSAPSDRIRTLAVTQKRHMGENFEEILSGTAAGQVVLDGAFFCGKDVRQIFPEDTQLNTIGAEAYAGVRLSDSAGQPIGLLAIVSSRPLPDIQLVQSVLEAFASRTAAELDRKRINDIRQQNEERYQAFISTNPDAMWRIEFEEPVPLNLPEDEQFDRIYRFGYLAECNEALAKMSGRSIEQLVGSRLPAIAPQSDPTIVEELRSAIHSGFRSTSVERTVYDENGGQFHRLRSQFGIIENGELRRLWFTTRDITDLRRAELFVAESQRRSLEVLEGVHLLAVILNPAGAITFCNDFFVRLTQRSKAELATLVWLDGVISQAESEIWRTAMQPERSRIDATTHFEGGIIPRDGELRPVLWDTICLRNQNDQITALAAIGRDVTYQKALELQIREAHKLDAIARFAAGVGHDFNNLLTLILGYTGQLIEQAPENDPARHSLSTIESAATMCAKLTWQPPWHSAAGRICSLRL